MLEAERRGGEGRKGTNEREKNIPNSEQHVYCSVSLTEVATSISEVNIQEAAEKKLIKVLEQTNKRIQGGENEGEGAEEEE